MRHYVARIKWSQYGTHRSGVKELACEHEGERMTVMTDLVDRLRAAERELADLRSSVEAGAPWSLSESFGTAPEANWGPPEILAHLAEMLPFWLGEMERVLDGPVEPVPFGRTAADQLRILSLERDRTLPLRELFDRIEAGVERYARRLPELSPQESLRRGLHSRLGELTVIQLVERFSVGHFEEHVRQLEASLGSPARSLPMER